MPSSECCSDICKVLTPPFAAKHNKPGQLIVVVIERATTLDIVETFFTNKGASLKVEQQVARGVI